LIGQRSVDSFATRINPLADKVEISTESGVLDGKLLHMALPVRWSMVGQESRAAVQMACTYDIHARGARLLSSRAVNPGDLVLVERGRNKAVCRVIWTADPETSLRGQFTVECVEPKTPWEDELRQMEEQYQPVSLDPAQSNQLSRGFSRPNVNRRRRPRFYVEGQAEMIDGAERVAADVEEISEFGARLSAIDRLRAGSDFRLMLSIFDVSLALKAQVKYHNRGEAMGVEFQEIRRGDRPLLSYVLSRVGKRPVAEFARVEVVDEPLPAK
jgi:hypothetical protein